MTLRILDLAEADLLLGFGFYEGQRHTSRKPGLVCPRFPYYNLPMKSYGEVVHLRLAARRREALIKSVRQARKEFKSGKCRPASPAEIMDNVLSQRLRL
jgi:hypothetical protein